VEPVPTTIGRYVVEGLVGIGAMGRIYKAHDPDIRRTVAIKLISTKLMSSADRADYIRRFRREAEAAARCVHPNIVTVYDFALHEGEPFLAMEFVYGISLRQALDEKPVMPVGEAIGIMLQVLDALHSMHGQGVIHQDIKPANIMLTPKHQVKVGDFGVSRISNTDTTSTMMTAGTPAYMSPEQCRGEQVDGRSDLFAAGTTLYEMLAGRRAYAGRNVTEVSHRIQNDRLPLLPAELRAAVPRLQLVLQRATGKHPEDRFDTAADMADALRQVLSGASEDATRVQAGGTTNSERYPPTVRVDPSARSLDSPSRPPEPPSPPADQSSRPPEPPSRPPEQPSPPLESTSRPPGPPLDSEALRVVEEKLTSYVGPIAPVLVRAAASRGRSIEELCAELALSVADEAERERFRREVERLLRPLRTPTGGTTSSQGSQPPTAARLPDQELERAQAALTEFVGPIARVLVRQAATRASTVEALWQALANNIESPGERTAFLKKRPR
jgi:eukaryotic-like serine/threonine-protein kinase